MIFPLIFLPWSYYPDKFTIGGLDESKNKCPVTIGEGSVNSKGKAFA